MRRIKLLFEDNEKTPSSKLLSVSYNGSDILFSGRTSRIYQVLMENYNEFDLFIVFMIPFQITALQSNGMICCVRKRLI